jgi:hypothetical protein
VKRDGGSLEFALARLQARHGQRLDEAAWRRIEGLRDFGGALEQARHTALQPWLASIAADSSPADVEGALRARWQGLVAEVESWMPPAWQPVVAWCATWPDLAPLQHLARGGAALPWMQDDPRWRTLARASAAERPAVLADGPWAPLAGAWRTPDALPTAWQLEWKRRCPRRRGADEAIAPLAALLRRHALAFAAAPEGQGPLQRAGLRARLTLLMRRATLNPAAVFIHLAISALDFERLRGELLRRVWFPRWKVA